LLSGVSSVGAGYLRESSGNNTPDVALDAALDATLEAALETPLADTDAVGLEAFGVAVGKGFVVAASVTIGDAVAVACTPAVCVSAADDIRCTDGANCAGVVVGTTAAAADAAWICAD